MKCRKCGYEVPTSARDCPACGTDNGYPNVRLAQNEAERRALEKRLLQAEESATAADYKHVLDQFVNAVRESRAVLARSIGVIQDLFEDRNKNYTSYHHHLAAKVRNPADNEFDRVRTQYESALFPNFYQEIIFASLTLNNKGVRGYGNYFIILKDEMLAHRATVFEENPHLFAQRYRILLSDPIPPGFRAIWEERDKLAKAKLYPKLTNKTQPTDFPSVLLEDHGGTGNSDFIEVHIYGLLNWFSVAMVVGTEPKTREDKLLWKILQKRVTKAGAEAVTT